jgi:hypothetical protein
MQIPDCKKTVISSEILTNKNGKRIQKDFCQFDVMGLTYYKSLYKPLK